MKKIVAISLSFMASILLSYSYAQWDTYQYLAKGNIDSLRVEELLFDAPSKPSEEIKKNTNTTTYKYKAKHNGVTYLILASQANVDVEAAGKSAEDVYASFSKKYTEVKQTSFVYGKRIGVEAKLKKEGTHINYRSIVIRNYVFQLITIKSNEFASSANANKFFTSFQFGEKKSEISLSEKIEPWSSKKYGPIHIIAGFPLEPNYTTKNGENAVVHRIQLTTADGITYAIVGTKSGSKQNSSEQNEVYSKFSKGGQVKVKTFWRIGSLTGIKAKLITKKGAHIHYRVLVIDDTIVQAMVIGNEKFAPEDKVNRFFNTLQLLN